jgi:hypothetical protein
MPMSRSVRTAGHAVLFLLFILASYAALRFLLDAVATDGWGPAALFGLLLLSGALSLTWRAATRLRRRLAR